MGCFGDIQPEASGEPPGAKSWVHDPDQHVVEGQVRMEGSTHLIVVSGFQCEGFW